MGCHLEGLLTSTRGICHSRLLPQAAFDKDLHAHMEQLINPNWLLWLFSKIDISLSMTADSAV